MTAESDPLAEVEKQAAKAWGVGSTRKDRLDGRSNHFGLVEVRSTYGVTIRVAWTPRLPPPQRPLIV